MSARLRVGIVGANADRGWARDAHVPALQRLPQFRIAAVSARNQQIAESARVALGAQRAYGDSLELVRAADIDIVAVTVKVPEHHAIVMAALAAGKHVYCEWPLGRDVLEAQEMAAAVGAKQHVMIGVQGLSAPAVRRAAELVSQGALGKLQIMRVFSPTAGWAAEAPPSYAYLQDKQHGATLATIAGGHTLAVLDALAGPYSEVDARNSTLLDRVKIQGTDAIVTRTCADHMLVLGKHASGCVSTLEVIGGVPSRPFTLELSGDRGWLKIAGGRAGGFQVGSLALETSVADCVTSAPIAPELVKSPAGHMAEAYTRFAADIFSGQRTVPDFALALRLTRLLARIELAADSGVRQFPSE